MIRAAPIAACLLPLGGAACLLLAGCAPAVRLAVPDAVLSDRWSDPVAADPGARAAPGGLGALLGAPALGALVAAAQAANPGLASADARVAAAAAALSGARAAALPVVTGSVTAGGLRATGPGGAQFSFGESFAAIDALLPLDVFGRVAAGARADAARLEATGLDRAALGIALEAAVGVAYVGRATLADRLRRLDRTIAQARELDRVIRIRAREGEATRVDVGLQTIRLRQLEAERTRLSEALAETRTALAALTGAEAPGFVAPDADDIADRVPTLAVPAPIAVLAARPDVRAAEARLRAAGGDVQAARAAFFPALTPSASVVARAGGIVVNPVATLTADLLAPIFARSALRAGLAATAAAQAEAAALYREAVLASLRDVEDALSAIRHARERAALLAEAEAAATTTIALARRRYLEGEIDIIQLLDAQDLLTGTQDARAIARQELLSATIALWSRTAA